MPHAWKDLAHSLVTLESLKLNYGFRAAIPSVQLASLSGSKTTTLALSVGGNFSEQNHHTTSSTTVSKVKQTMKPMKANHANLERSSKPAALSCP